MQEEHTECVLLPLQFFPPFVVNRVSEIHYAWTSHHTTRSPSEAISAMLPDTLLFSLFTFAMFVAVPLAVALITSHVAYKARNIQSSHSFCEPLVEQQ